MKTWLKSSISLVLGILILLTGSGISLAKMNCLKSGFIAITLNTPDDCCKHEDSNAPVTIDEKCCDISNMNVDILHYVVSATQNFHKSIQSADLPSAITINDYTRADAVVTLILQRYADPCAASAPPLRILTKSFLI